MNNLNEIRKAIHALTNRDDLEEVYHAYRARMSALRVDAARQWDVGDRVTFTARGRTVECTIIKVNIKTVTVKEDDEMGTVTGPDGVPRQMMLPGVSWRVSPELLTKKED